MNRKQKIIVSVTGIFLVLLILVGLAYAYFLTQIVGNTNRKSVTFATADLELTYADGDGQILTSDTVLLPSSKEINTKTFTVTNNNAKADYIVVLDNVNITKDGVASTFVSNDFVYTLACNEYDTDEYESVLTTATYTECKGVERQTTLPLTENGILIGNNIPAGKTQVYTFKLWYLETDQNQSGDMGKKLEARININDIKVIQSQKSESNLLAYNIINNALNETNGTELVNTPPTEVAVNHSTDDEKVMSVEKDDYGTSYYFRGSVEDNYVSFNNMCWRIVRIEGDGTIKLILEDKDETCSTIMDTDWNIGTGNYGYIEKTIVNSEGNTITVVMFDYLNPQTNKESSMNVLLSNWFNSNSFDTSKLKYEEWCLENTTDVYDSDGVLFDDTIDNLIYNGTNFYFNTRARLYGHGTKETASLMCGTSKDVKFNSYVGAITADEVVFAGAMGDSGEDSYAKIYLRNKYQMSSHLAYLTLSLSRFYNNSNKMSVFHASSGGYISSTLVDATPAIRPAIVLNKNTVFSSGDGTVGNPYIIS